ncbi:multiple RNA-binding domain-containing protein 1 [Dioszegia hungarica]|uniref:Multiple RNA-binding domain-containing protein 1 n=1 Tax=Dioszegia hungarica TaxID=4972 RepID=A0AA38H673_9TREE|nr:multiple RNA-binding domain-containing protein 1 [Dioszegia hungarica]KAI9634522.1 multiple RNA-binding domain-containing protein 1 [Dioszegia hungarica]
MPLNMSRLIFRNIPSDLTLDKLKSHLSTPPSLKDTNVTDTKLVSKRRFAFVGFKDEQQAARVKEWFDGTYAFGGGKVKVEVVRDDPLSEKPSKKPRLDRQQDTGYAPPPDGRDGPAEAGPSKRLKEFMDVMKGVDPTAPEAAPKEFVPSRKGKEKSVEPEVEEVDDDAAWLARRTGALATEEGTQATSDPDESLILSTGRLFVRNLPFITTSADLSSHFSTFGTVEQVHVPVTSKGEPLGTAFVLFSEPAAAVAAWRGLDKKTFQGRLLHVLPGRARPGDSEGGKEGKGPQGLGEGKGDVLGKTKEGRDVVKGKKDEKRKETNARGVNWAALYMNSDAVAASVADRMGVSKADILNGEEGNAAVKLALAETAVIAETKQYFEDAGIVLAALDPKVPRSPTVILVKNIPYGTTIHTLTDLFSPHGKMTRILLPPSGTLGVVEYEQAVEASSAFKALSYKRLGSAVLYLEKGPQGMFKAGPKATEAEKQKEELAARVAEADVSLQDQPAPSDEAGSTVFLKNLSFGTSTARLASVLSSLPDFSFARVQTKPDPKRPGEKLSMGYGFIGFKTKAGAQRGLRALEGFEVDGKVLEAKLAQRGAEEEKAEPKKGGADLSAKTKSTKLLVKNVPFEASRSELRELFSAYGALKSLRLPRKSVLTTTGNKSTRGFAFLEFTTHAEAERAMEALKHTHLLGRHLVIEWAKEGEGVDVDRLREKVRGEVKGMEEWEKRAKSKRKFDGGAENEENDGMEPDV